MKSLDEIFHDTLADKASGLHGYAPYYDSIFSKWRDQPISVLELGVAMGASVEGWLRYFPNAQVTGVDGLTYISSNDRYMHFTGDVTQHDLLHTVGRTRGKFDIIVDDCSHRNADQILAFYDLWPFLNGGGIYCIEDIQPWFDSIHGPEYNGGWQNFLKTLLWDLNDHSEHYCGRPVPCHTARIHSDIAKIEFTYGVMAVFKK
jgi:hypothetical protein